MPRTKQPERIRYKGVLESNKQHIKDYLIHISSNSTSSTVMSKETFLLDFAKVINKDFKQVI